MRYFHHIEGPRWSACYHLAWTLIIQASLPSVIARADEADTPIGTNGPPGVVITHIPASTQRFIGSPSIVRMPEGTLLASHDEFGPQSNEHQRAITHLYSSQDNGGSWSFLAKIDGQFWSKLFFHEGQLYLFGTWAHHGNLIIRRSDDGGMTWTTPDDNDSGLLAEGQYHCTPQPMLLHQGRLWRAVEDASGGNVWGERYRPLIMSAPVNANLLRRKSWTFSNHLTMDKSWLEGEARGWLEGNTVVAPDGHIVNMLRVAAGTPVVNKAAILTLTADGTKLSFDPTSGFVDFPGGSKKFTIQYDPQSCRYWSLVNPVPAELAGTRAASSIRNQLALVSSDDLRQWNIERVIIDDPDLNHGYQYADWLFDGTDIIAVVRTATEDEQGGANNYHNANYLTFHRIGDFAERQETAPQGRRDLP